MAKSKIEWTDTDNPHVIDSAAAIPGKPLYQGFALDDRLAPLSERITIVARTTETPTRGAPGGARGGGAVCAYAIEAALMGQAEAAVAAALLALTRMGPHLASLSPATPTTRGRAPQLSWVGREPHPVAVWSTCLEAIFRAGDWSVVRQDKYRYDGRHPNSTRQRRCRLDAFLRRFPGRFRGDVRTAQSSSRSCWSMFPDHQPRQGVHYRWHSPVVSGVCSPYQPGRDSVLGPPGPRPH